MAEKDRTREGAEKNEPEADNGLLEKDEADAQGEGNLDESVEPEIGSSEVEEHYKGPVRYHLTLRARDLYLLVFGAALVIFAAFTLGAIVGRYLGPYPNQQVTAGLERQDLFNEGKEQTVEPTPDSTQKPAPSPSMKHEATSKPQSSSSEPFHVQKGEKLLSLIATPTESPKATPTPRARRTPVAIATATPSPKPTDKARQVPKKETKTTARGKTPIGKKASSSAKKSSVSTYYSVQVGAFKRRTNAQREVNNLKRLGFYGWIKPPTKRVHFYCVLVGKKKSAAERAPLVKKLRKAGYKSVLLKTFHEMQ
ncbi:MAG TPA: SPOR domain-containing protein [bacterium]|nr:SPOR domain-containing protein [bacterium]